MDSLHIIPQQNPVDISSYANFPDIVQKHIDLDTEVDFEKQIIKFESTITLEVISQSLNHIVLDLNKIKIISISSEQIENLKYYLYENNPKKNALGTPLVITFSKIKDKTIKLKIVSETTSESPSIKFLSKEQTYTKKYPFMFTQCEPILCRSLLPCQDSPGMKVTMNVKVKSQTGLTSLFSGIETKHYESDDKKYSIYEYEQKVPMPTYLIAFACGELEYGKLSERCGVWTEKGLVEKALYDFEKTELFLSTAEKYLTPYVWGKYNVLVLPASFPYGGMENPCLTFVTPSLLAGDQSMANVIAHEISHSWTGNLVTNKNWKNFWMNEGFTTFLERKIGELVYGEDFSLLEKQVGLGRLNAAIEQIGINHNFTSLSPDFTDCDPDDGFSTVPYEKGFTFLEFLETLIGKDKFQQTMKQYIETYQYTSVTYEDFKKTFVECNNDNQEALNKIDWEKWVTSTGFPVQSKSYNSKLIKEAEELGNEFMNNTIKKENKDKIISQFKSWHTNQKIVFFDFLLKNISKINEDVYVNLRDILELHNNYNSEVRNLWNLICLKTKHSDCVDYLKQFLQAYGRMKYIKPLYFEWYKFQPEQAGKFFEENKYLYHPVAARLISDKFEQMKKENNK